jgi:hypothetical protein
MIRLYIPRVGQTNLLLEGFFFFWKEGRGGGRKGGFLCNI